MFDHFLVWKGLAEHRILEKSEKEQTEPVRENWTVT